MNCKQCQVEIPKNRTFCSKRCTSRHSNNARSERAKAKNLKKCLICDDMTINAKFCGHKCYSKYLKEKEKKRYFCRGCDCLLAIGWENVRNNYCDVCIENGKNPNIKNWSMVKQGELKKRLGTQQFHARVRALSRVFYRRSDKPKLCCVCGYNKFYEVCHIIPINKFNDESSIAEINSLENLIALCPNCHWELDNGLIKIAVPKIEFGNQGT